MVAGLGGVARGAAARGAREYRDAAADALVAAIRAETTESPEAATTTSSASRSSALFWSATSIRAETERTEPHRTEPTPYRASPGVSFEEASPLVRSEAALALAALLDADPAGGAAPTDDEKDNDGQPETRWPAEVLAFALRGAGDASDAVSDAVANELCPAAFACRAGAARSGRRVGVRERAGGSRRRVREAGGTTRAGASATLKALASAFTVKDDEADEETGREETGREETVRSASTRTFSSRAMRWTKALPK